MAFNSREDIIILLYYFQNIVSNNSSASVWWCCCVSKPTPNPTNPHRRRRTSYWSPLKDKRREPELYHRHCDQGMPTFLLSYIHGGSAGTDWLMTYSLTFLRPIYRKMTHARGSRSVQDLTGLWLLKCCACTGSNLSKSVTWCFTPSQPVRLYQGKNVQGTITSLNFMMQLWSSRHVVLGVSARTVYCPACCPLPVTGCPRDDLRAIVYCPAFFSLSITGRLRCNFRTMRYYALS